MNPARSFSLVTALLVSFWTSTADVWAARDETNQGRWAKPVENGPDKDVPGFLVNLGPTGARAVLKEKSFVVKYVFPGSPAEGRLQPNDEIVGVDGKEFSTCTFGGRSVGYEGPIMDFGNAIEDSEGKDGKLVLRVKRNARSTDVEIQLKPIGRFGPEFPVGCKKSEYLKQQAYKYLVDNPDSFGGMSHSRSTVALAFLTSGNTQYESTGKGIAQRWNRVPGTGTWSWNLSYQIITLAEYHLLTGDKSVLPTIEGTSKLLERAQYKGKVQIYPETTRSKESQLVYVGGFGHAPYDGSGLSKNGYGPMQYTTILAVIAWQLAEQCGIEVNDAAVKAAMEFIYMGTRHSGYVAYGTESTFGKDLLQGIENWKRGSGDSYVGRSGCALIAHMLSPEFDKSAAYVKRSADYLSSAYRSLPDGHACAILGFSWGLLGAAASHDKKVMRTVYDYHKAWFNMARCHDGSFVVLPGRDYADGSYYRSSRYHLTGVMALFLGLNNPKLQIQGVRISIPGVNHKALRGAHAAAYEQIVKKNYGAAAKALTSSADANDTTAAKMMQVIDKETKVAIDHFGKLDQDGKWHTLKQEIELYRRMFGGVPLFDREAERWETSFGEKLGGLIVGADKHFDEASYGKASDAIEKVLASSGGAAFAEQAKRRAERIDRVVKDTIRQLEEMEKNGEWQSLKEEIYLKKKKQFGGIKAFDERAAAWRKLLATPTGRTMVEAHKLHLDRSYGPSARALARMGPDTEHAAAAKALMDRNRAAAQRMLRELEGLEASGRWHTLKEAIFKAKFKMSGIELFDKKAAALETLFKTKFGKIMIMADRLFGRRSYKQSLRALESAVASADQPGQAEVARRLVQAINQEVLESMEILMLMEKEGDWYLLKKSLVPLKQRLSGVPVFDEKAQAWESAFKTEPIAEAIKVGYQYHRLAYMVSRKPSTTNLNYLRAFVKKHGDSFYGKEAKKLLDKHGR